MDDEKMQAYKDASAGRRASVFDPKALSKMKQSVSSSVKSAAESASTGVKNATDTGTFRNIVIFIMQFKAKFSKTTASEFQNEKSYPLFFIL